MKLVKVTSTWLGHKPDQKQINHVQYWEESDTFADFLVKQPPFDVPMDDGTHNEVSFELVDMTGDEFLGYCEMVRSVRDTLRARMVMSKPKKSSRRKKSDHAKN